MKYNSDARDDSRLEKNIFKTREEKSTEIDDLEEDANLETHDSGICRTVTNYDDEIYLPVDKNDLENMSNEFHDESEHTNDVLFIDRTGIDEIPIENRNILIKRRRICKISLPVST